MYCHNCGKQIPDGVKFCRYCGASQAIVYGGASAAAMPIPQNNAQPAAQPSEYPYNYFRQQSTVSSQPRSGLEIQPQPVLQPQPQSVPQPQPVLQPQSQPVPQPQPQLISTVSGFAMLASQACSYKIAVESDFKKFEFGGMPEGTVEIYDDRLEFFSKNKMVKLAFGMIGSALSGKGKVDITIPAFMVRRDTVINQKNVFRFYLTDGRLAYIQLNGLTGQQEARSAMQRFLKM